MSAEHNMVTSFARQQQMLFQYFLLTYVKHKLPC